MTSTLAWWAFAFAPVPAHPPGWLTAARYACFGAMESELPGVSGWMLLGLAPLTFLAGIVVLWASDLPASVRHVAGTRAGLVALAVLVLALVIESVWVVDKVQAARAITSWAETLQDD